MTCLPSPTLLPNSGTLYVSAGPITSGSLAGVSFRAATDSRGLRMMKVGLQGSLSVNSIMSKLGVPNSALVDVDGVMTLSEPSVTFVRSITGAPGGNFACLDPKNLGCERDQRSCCLFIRLRRGI